MLRGSNLATNLEFHYGLVNWFIGQNINARPTTRFIVPYLTAVGELKAQANSLDLSYAYQQISRQLLSAAEGDASSALSETLQMKESLLLRPLQRLLDEPHILSGWLSVNRDSYTMIDDKISWNENPVELLADTYHFLNMDYIHGDKPPAAVMIWDHDDAIMQEALAFYSELNTRLDADVCTDEGAECGTVADNCSVVRTCTDSCAPTSASLASSSIRPVVKPSGRPPWFLISWAICGQ